MTSAAGEPRSFARPQLAWAVPLLIIICSALAWTASVATAKRESPQQTPTPPAALAGSTATPAPAAAKPEAPPTPLDASKKHRERPPAGAGQQTTPRDPAARVQPGGAAKAEACCAAAPRPASSARRAHRLRAEGKRPGGRAGEAGSDGQGQVAASEGEGEEGQGGQSSAAPAAALQARKGKGRHGKGKEPKSKEPKAKEPKGKKEPKGGGHGGKETEQGSHQPVAVTAPAARATSVTPAAPAPALLPPPPIAPVVLAPRIVGEAPSASSGSLASRSARRTRRASRGSARTIAASALAPALLAAPARVTGAKHAPAATRRPARPTQSQLVTTVTRIIAVVPALVWSVIGALAALALALGAVFRLAALRARRLARQRQELLADVGLLQAALLPALPGRLGPVGTSAAYRPASGPGAGGDFYDVFALADGQLAVIVGDVSGHGRQALPHTTLLRFTLRAYMEAGLSPRASLQAAAPVLERQLGGSFATVVLATYQPRERTLTYASAGHPPPVVAAGTQSIAAITACSSPPLGAGQPTGRRQTVVSIPGEALACFYTDGVIEARVGRELFGASRLKQTLAELGPQASASAVLDQVAEQSDRRPDDMAACLLRIEGDELAPRLEVEELELDRHDVERGRAERFLLAGGLEESEVGEALASIRAAVARYGGVVLELHLGEKRPEVALRPQNVAMLQPPSHAIARAVG
jgi:serine phosphatase RsbU (regulator of sigma subunit)